MNPLKDHLLGSVLILFAVTLSVTHIACGTSAQYSSPCNTESCKGKLNVESSIQLVPKLEDVALTQESRIAGFLDSDKRLVVLNTQSGEEVWWRENVESQLPFIPYSVRDGSILRSKNSLQLFLLNGGNATLSVEGAHLVGRGGQETQFVASYERKAEVLSLLDANSTAGKVSLAYDEGLFAKDSMGVDMPYRDSIHTFFASETNDTLISLNLLSLKFFVYSSTGLSNNGATQFSADKTKFCEAADLNLVSDVLLNRSSNTSTSLGSSTAIFDVAKIPVAYALDSAFKGVLLKTRDQRLIYLDFNAACAKISSLKILALNSPSTTTQTQGETLLSLGNDYFANKTTTGEFNLFKVTATAIEKIGNIENVCPENILTHKVYERKILIVCGSQSTDGLKIATLSAIQLLDLYKQKALASTSFADERGIAGMAFDNTSPKLFILSNRSVGKLTSIDFTGDSAKQEVKTNFILKNILDKL